MTDKITLFQNSRIWNSIRDQVYDMVDLEHGLGLAQNGPLTVQLEKELAARYGRKHCVTMANCTDALTTAVALLDLKPGSLVGVPNYTFTATAHAVARAGHTVVPVDVSSNYCVDTSRCDDMQALINVDLFGNMNNWTMLDQLGIPVINDAAQSLESYDGRAWSVTKGVISCVSFSPSKTISSWGSGGALLTDNDDLAERARKLRLHGKSRNDRKAIAPGLNSMMSTFEAAAVLVGLQHSQSWLARRQHIARWLVGRSRYPCANDLDLPQHGLSKLVFQCEDRERVKAQFQNNGIDFAIHYEQLINDEPLYRSNTQMPVSDKLKHISFTVPNQHTLTDTEVERIAEILA